ncbi:MAG: cytochrome c oxidase accessory protein CcoG [Verrucomicrobia bacterium]|nr:cytochrome c oxidase accessory protein CcoG [Verrucomicrobiota bacterium]
MNETSSPAEARAKSSGRPTFRRPERDSVTTIQADGSRFFLHPSDVRGVFTRARRWSGWLLIALYLVLPWIPVGGYPAVLLDVAARRFHFFGLTLAIQDTWLLFFGITGLGFSLFLITALLGRVWCGWACPQTVFLDHVFRRVERWLEGDAIARRQLDASRWTSVKIVRRGAKQFAFILLSGVIAHLFLAYFVSIPRLWGMMGASPGDHWASFVFIFIFTAVLYFNFAWFREQLCIVLCPYGRLQSALIDDHSLVIGYDARRGEPRGKLHAPAAGACIDCNRCVQVCPTGIDIRQGLQIECIGCAACIDACDDVMTRVGRPRGLIRYDSLTAFAGGVTRWLRPRTLVYAALLLAGAAVAAWALSTVRPANIGVTRMTGAPYFVDARTVRNQFLVRLVNKRDVPARFIIALSGAPVPVEREGLDGAVEIGPMAEEVRPLILQVTRTDYVGSFVLTVNVTDEAGTFTLAREVEFIGPDPVLLGIQGGGHEGEK